jgi:hypothetical protein
MNLLPSRSTPNDSDPLLPTDRPVVDPTARNERCHSTRQPNLEQLLDERLAQDRGFLDLGEEVGRTLGDGLDEPVDDGLGEEGDAGGFAAGEDRFFGFDGEADQDGWVERKGQRRTMLKTVEEGDTERDRV